MEWVITAGASVDEARDRALDALGVALEDADIEVLAEPARAPLGLRTHPARVRARVTPLGPPVREDQDRRNRRRPRRNRSSGRRNSSRNRSRNRRR